MFNKYKERIERIEKMLNLHDRWLEKLFADNERGNVLRKETDDQLISLDEKVYRMQRQIEEIEAWIDYHREEKREYEAGQGNMGRLQEGKKNNRDAQTDISD